MTEKRAKRGNGDGSKPKLRADGRWVSNLTVGLRPDGTAILQSVYGKTQAECMTKLRAARTELDNGTLSIGASPTLIAWLDHWLNDIAPTTKIQPRTLNEYRSKVDNYVRPHRIARKRLKNLQPEDIGAIYQSMREPQKAPAGSKLKDRPALSESTIAGLHRVLRRGLNVAIQRKKLTVNPAKLMDSPQVPAFRPNVLTTEEAKKLITKALSMEGGARWVLALTIGVRQSEALGVSWGDVNFEAEKMTIRNKLYKLPWKHGCAADGAEPVCGRKRGDGCTQRRDGGFFVGNPKSDAGARTVIMPMQLTESLRQHRKKQLGERGSNWAPFKMDTGEELDLVFSRDDGRPMDNRLDWSSWKKFLDEAGVPEVRVHDARHTAATTLLLLGVQPRVVMDILGWSQASMLTRYQHVLDEMKRDAADRIANLWAEDQPAASNVVSFDALRNRRAR